MSETTTCRSCGASNDSGQSFCGSCGGVLGRECPSCGTTNPVSFRFCGSCGAAMEEVPGRESAVEERRWATVLFADLSGFTTMSEQMDPEDIRAMVDDCQQKMGAIIGQFGGVVNSVMGDGFMAMFGAPVAHEDDPERAVRAALELQRCVQENTEQFGGLPLRVGVNSGDVMFAVVGRDPTLIGDTTNTAARLQSAAPRGGVLVGETTYRATRHSIRYESVEPIALKGKAVPVAAWLAIEPVLAPAERPISTGPMVGRDRELSLLTGIWERVVGGRRPHLVTIMAPPGIGKSRLAREFEASVEARGGRVVRGRSHPYGEIAGYGAFGRLARGILGIYVTDPPPIAHAKLRRRLASLLPQADADELDAHVAVLVGLADATAEDRGVLFMAGRRFVEVLAREQPTVFVFEDIQWANPSLLDLIEYLAGRVRDAPALFLTLARPTLLDARPGWGGGLLAYTAMPLEALDDEQARTLASSLLASRPGSGALAGRVLAAVGGNPLFIEELVASLLERGSDDTVDLPTNIKTIITARIDALTAPARQAIFRAAVVGEVFWRGALERLGGDAGSLGEAIDELELRDMIRREPSSRIQGDEEFSFKHGLIREVAYGTLPKTVRRELHRGVAQFLEETAQGGAISAAAWLAHHWREAGDRDRTVDSLLAAADQAARGWAAREAVALCEEALGLLEAGDARVRRARMLRVVALQAAWHADQGDVAGAPSPASGGPDQVGKSEGEMSPPIS